MKNALFALLFLGLAISGMAKAEVTWLHYDSSGNPISEAEYNRQMNAYNNFYSGSGRSSGWITVGEWSYSSGSGYSSYSRNSTNFYGSSNSTNYHFGNRNYTDYNYGRTNGTINNYGNSNLTINNYGNSNTTVNDYGGGRTTVNRRGRRR